MAKIKPVRKKQSKVAPFSQGGASCLILILSGMLLIFIFLYLALKYANG